MPLADHKEMSRRAIEMWASNNSDTPEDVFAENYVNHQESDVKGSADVRSLTTWKDLVADFHKGFSNCTTVCEIQIAEGDLVATRFQFTATNTGHYLGHAPTGKEVTWTGIEIDRFENGKIVESWVDWDKYRFFQGLGLVK
jgi:predicted ester cyclase